MMSTVSTTRSSEPDSLHVAALRCLDAKEPDDKVALTREAVASWNSGTLFLEKAPDTLAARNPGMPAALQLVGPADVPRRRLRGKAGTAPLLHALAHIEFNAINLAWDCVARFTGFPRRYYDDWVSVAGEEAEHFALLRKRLRELGREYGDFPAHTGLWDMAVKTAEDPLARMAMVPRYLEARGLDVAPAMILKLDKVGDHASAEIVRRILADEVGHVGIGSHWFRYLCSERGLEPDGEFLRLLDAFGAGDPKGPLNLEARTRAGFTPTEIEGIDGRRRR
jgi:uncharacterized ferritin-like protein (DUF455 family)